VREEAWPSVRVLGLGGRTLSAAAPVSCQVGLQRVSPTVGFLSLNEGVWPSQ